MVSSVYWEWELLLQTMKLGVKLAFVYDGIRIFRFLISHKNIVISIEDLFFWIYAAIIIFELQLEQSDGVLRGFSILGMFVGMFLYNKILGERLVLLAEKGISLFKRQLTEMGKVFKIKLCKRRNISEKNRSKHGKKKESCKGKETESTGSSPGCNGSSDNACGSSRK